MSSRLNAQTGRAAAPSIEDALCGVMDAYNRSMADSELKIAALQKRVAELEGYIAQAKSDHEAHIRTFESKVLDLVREIGVQNQRIGEYAEEHSSFMSTLAKSGFIHPSSANPTTKLEFVSPLRSSLAGEKAPSNGLSASSAAKDAQQLFAVDHSPDLAVLAQRARLQKSSAKEKPKSVTEEDPFAVLPDASPTRGKPFPSTVSGGQLASGSKRPSSANDLQTRSSKKTRQESTTASSSSSSNLAAAAAVTTCPDCVRFYNQIAAAEPGIQLGNLVQQCSRHRQPTVTHGAQRPILDPPANFASGAVVVATASQDARLHAEMRMRRV